MRFVDETVWLTQSQLFGNSERHKDQVCCVILVWNKLHYAVLIACRSGLCDRTGELRIELRSTVLETVILPLNYSPMASAERVELPFPVPETGVLPLDETEIDNLRKETI